jgi:hypothetical protein
LVRYQYAVRNFTANWWELKIEPLATSFQLSHASQEALTPEMGSDIVPALLRGLEKL